MANQGNKVEFLKELDIQIKFNSQWLEEIGADVKRHNQNIADFQKSRQGQLEEYAISLLPDLARETLVELDKKVPNLLSSLRVRETSEIEVAGIQERIDTLKGKFDTANYESNKASLDFDLGQVIEEHKKFQDGLTNLLGIPGCQDLIDAGFGTDAYPHTGFLKLFSLQYHRDWHKSDKVVEVLKKRDWAEVLADYTEIKGIVDDADRNAKRIREEIKALDTFQETHTMLQNSLKRVDETVTEKLRIKIKAHLDSLSPAPEWMEAVRNFDFRIKEAQVTINTILQPRRQQISAQMTQLQQLRAGVEKSRKDVPADYIRKLRNKNQSFAGADFRRQENQRQGIHYSPTVQPHYTFWVNNDWYVDDCTSMLDYYQPVQPAPIYDRTAYDQRDSTVSNSFNNDVTEQQYGRVS